ncbi:MAG: DMT family protein [Betaproteobacteria bacterium]|nr:DMT family protein [Betaproteobacteria bacterium]
MTRRQPAAPVRPGTAERADADHPPDHPCCCRPNVFLTFAWCAHLRDLSAKPWWIAALVSWGIAFFEYMIQVPANRIGYGSLTLAQLKIMQEIIALSVFVPFAVFYMDQPLKLDYLWASLCLVGAAYFMFRT